MSEKIYCKECRAELNNKIKFCPECGKSVPKPKPVTEPKVKELPWIMTLNEAAAFLKISRSKIYSLVRENKIPYFPVGSHKRFLTRKLIEWAEGNPSNNLQKEV
jgi:excisionase family DNA binding protein